jgi:RNA-binding protein
VLKTPSKKELKARAHSLRPVVIVGQKGLSAAVVASIDEALIAHQLIKVRLPTSDKENQLLRIAQITEVLQAHVVGTIGRVLILYRELKDQETPTKI